MVDIYLNINCAPVRLLSIPLDDIRRLSIRPLKWLRFVTFAVCGALGDLSQTEDGPTVEYGAALFADLVDSYYYIPYGEFIFVDFNGSTDRITTSAPTPRRSSLRVNLLERDGPFCVITGDGAQSCDGVHIIPRSKGDEYIEKVIQDRSILYSSEEIKTSRIDDVENAILLRRDLHPKFAAGNIAFLKVRGSKTHDIIRYENAASKTPNFALDPDDIPKVEEGPTPSNRITLQYLASPSGLDPVRPRDVRFRGTGHSPPPAILLDYMYGVAAYQRWKGGPDVDEMMQRYFTDHYKSIPPLPHDDAPRTPPTRRHHESHMWDGMLQAMDELNVRIMGFRGITPEVRTAQQRRKEEEEQDASRKKVLDWMNTSHGEGL